MGSSRVEPRRSRAEESVSNNSIKHALIQGRVAIQLIIPHCALRSFLMANKKQWPLSHLSDCVSRPFRGHSTRPERSDFKSSARGRITFKPSLAALSQTTLSISLSFPQSYFKQIDNFKRVCFAFDGRGRRQKNNFYLTLEMLECKI